MNQEAYKLMKEKSESLSLSKKTEDSLSDSIELTSESSSGNEDDCFNDGRECADAETALFAREFLRQVSELEKMSNKEILLKVIDFHKEFQGQGTLMELCFIIQKEVHDSFTYSWIRGSGGVYSEQFEIGDTIVN